MSTGHSNKLPDPRNATEYLFRKMFLNWTILGIGPFIVVFAIVKTLVISAFNRNGVEVTETTAILVNLFLLTLSAGFVISTSWRSVQPMYAAELLFFGKETGIRIYGSEGVRFIPFANLGVVSFFLEEITHSSISDLKLDPFKATDKTGKTYEIPESSINWWIGDNSLQQERYQKYNAKEIPAHLAQLLKEAIINVIEGSDYKNDFAGNKEAFIQKLKQDFAYKKHIHYGIEFGELNVIIFRSKMEQENWNTYRKDLTQELKAERDATLTKDPNAKVMTDREIAEVVGNMIGLEDTKKMSLRTNAPMNNSNMLRPGDFDN